MIKVMFDSVICFYIVKNQIQYKNQVVKLEIFVKIRQRPEVYTRFTCWNVVLAEVISIADEPPK